LGERWDSRKPEDVDAIVEGNDYDVFGAGEILAIIEWSLSIANIESYNALILASFLAALAESTYVRHKTKPV
jgi:hypothetical protein